MTLNTRPVLHLSKLICKRSFASAAVRPRGTCLALPQRCSSVASVRRASLLPPTLIPFGMLLPSVHGCRRWRC